MNKSNNTPLRGKRLLVFGLLFGGFMLYIGYVMLSGNNRRTDITNTEQILLEKAYESFGKGMAHYDQGQLDSAIVLFNESVRLGYPIGYALLGECELQRGNLTAAEDFLLKALEIPNGEMELKGYYAGVNCNLGLVHMQQNKPNLAKPYFEKASELGNETAREYLKKLES